MNRFVCLLFTAAAVATLDSLPPASAAVVEIDTVPIGNPGNPPHPDYVASVGPLAAVPYEYRIGTYEVTNAQYAEFLNAKAGSDTLSLYSTEMMSSYLGGIIRQGASPNYNYTVKDNMGNKPVVYVNWWDAERFANWMHNGQGSGDTETGSYKLLGGTPTPTNNLETLVRQPGATWVLPTENEWDKAAYYDPLSEAEGGPPGDDHYWLYPTRSDVVPTNATDDEFGNVSNPGPNVATAGAVADWNGPFSSTTVGSAGPLSTSYYGTYDQAGNVLEWTGPSFGTRTRPLGGANENLIGPSWMTPAGRDYWVASGLGSVDDYAVLGFRLALVPEPSTCVEAAFGFLALAAAAKWRNR